MKHNSNIQNRRGFTLIELLMVVAIIGLLAALSVTVMIGIADQANEAATVSTIRKIDAMVEKRIEGFNRAFDRGGQLRDRYVAATRNLLIQDGIFGPLVANRQDGEGDSAVVEALAKKVAMRHLFPQRHEDLLLLGFNNAGTISDTDFTAGDDIEPVADRVLDVNGNRIADVVEATATDPSLLPTADAWVLDKTVSAELLYYFLVYGEGFGASESVEDQFTTAEIGDTDNDGLPEFLDGWGQPLRFYRWPTRMIDDNPPSPFQPFLTTTDPTDLDPSPDGIPANDNTRGREITAEERLVANIMLKGLPPAPTSLPSGALPRDLLMQDPDDPVGVLYRALEEYSGAPSTGAPFADEFNATNYHTPDTYHFPMIVSSGADEVLGMFEPSDTPNFGNLGAYDLSNGVSAMVEQIGDNLTNRNRRAGGRR